MTGATGREGKYFRESYLTLEGLPLSVDAEYYDPASLSVRKELAPHLVLYFYLALVASKSQFGPDVAAVTVPEILRCTCRGRRRTYESLNALAEAGYVFSVPAPKHPALRGCSRVFCLRVPRSLQVITHHKREFQHDGAAWLGKSRDDPSSVVLLKSDPSADAEDPTVGESSTSPVARPPTPREVVDSLSDLDRGELTEVALRAIDAKFGPRERMRVKLVARAELFVHPMLGVPGGKHNPHNLERAVDILPRARYRNEIAALFTERCRDKPKPPGGSAMYPGPPILPSTEFEETPFAAQQYERFGDGPRILLDGDTHPLFPGFIAQGGCLHAPVAICKCSNRKRGLREDRVVFDPLPSEKKKPLWAYLVMAPFREPSGWVS